MTETERDIVYRLRALTHETELSNRHLNVPDEAADEIDRLRSELQAAKASDSVCPHIVTTDEGTSHCALAESGAQQAETVTNHGERRQKLHEFLDSNLGAIATEDDLSEIENIVLSCVAVEQAEVEPVAWMTEITAYAPVVPEGVIDKIKSLPVRFVVGGQRAAYIQRDEVLDALSSTPQPAGGVPDGWQLVPMEPTPDMQNNGAEARLSGEAAAGIWRAMLSAAPQQEDES